VYRIAKTNKSQSQELSKKT